MHVMIGILNFCSFLCLDTEFEYLSGKIPRYSLHGDRRPRNLIGKIEIK